MSALRPMAAGITAAVLWALTAVLARFPGGASVGGWLEQVLVPGPLVRIGELPAPWPQITVGAGALLLGALVTGAALLAHGPSRVPIVWLGTALGALVVGATMGVGTIIGEVPRLGVSYPVADVAQELGTQAWGLLLGWIPALVAGWSRADPARSARACVIAVVAVAVAAALVTGVGTGVGGPLRFAALDKQAAAPASPSPTPSVSYSPQPVPDPPYALASTTCAPGALVLATTGGSGAAGHRDFAIEIRNASTTTCTLDGYPAVAFRDAEGRPVPAVIQTGRSFMDEDHGAASITLVPGATAVASIGWDAGASSGDPTLAHQLALRIHAGSGELTFPSGPFDVVGGTPVTVQAWHAGALLPD